LRTRQQARRGGGDDRGRQRSGPEASGGQNREVLYGRNAVRESLRAGKRRHIRLTIAEGVEHDAKLDEIVSLARSRGVRVEHAPRDRIESLAGPGHQGILIEASSYAYASGTNLEKLARERAIVLALDSVEDPRNAGTLLRTAEAVGVQLVVIPSDRSVGITPGVVNASSGAVEYLTIQRETNLARWLGIARDAGFWVVGLSGDEGSDPLFDTDVAAPVVLVVGSEGRGMRRLIREQCDLMVSLPMLGRIESLNAAVAGSIALYEIQRDSVDTSR
jgi:23S rRNA (guanosine2251-2'-O)-methyltransferase